MLGLSGRILSFPPPSNGLDIFIQIQRMPRRQKNPHAGVKSRHWCVTIFPGLEELALFTDKWAKHELIRFATGQPEKAGTTDRLHWQCYFEFERAVRTSQAQKILGAGKCHVEPRGGTQQDAIAYCTKEATRVDGAEPFTVGTPSPGRVWLRCYFCHRLVRRPGNGMWHPGPC